MSKRENMDNQVKVSVIIATYNHAKSLLRAIQSVQRQTERNVEILICDDGSTDETKKTVLDLCKTDERIRYIECSHNRCPAILRNIGIKNAKGEWLAFLDDDDIWNPVKLEAQLYRLYNSGLKACCTNAFLYENGKNTGRLYFHGEKDNIYSFKDIVIANPVIFSSMLVQKSLIMECEGFPEEEELVTLDDYCLWYRVVGSTEIYYIGKALIGCLNTNTTSIKQKRRYGVKKRNSKVENNFSKWIEKKDKVLKDYYRKERKRSSILKLRKQCGELRRRIKTPIKRLIKRLIKRG